MHTEFVSFDGNERAACELCRPEKYSDLFSCVDGRRPVIARGGGLSYCAASFGKEYLSVDLSRFNRVLRFDKTHGEIEVEPGITISELQGILIAHDFYLPSLPGYPDITVGGCVAFNVHGKSQYGVGNFQTYVKSFRLYHPQHGELDCSRDRNQEVFELTIGGFGLTGILTGITLQAHKFHGKKIGQQKFPCQSIAEAVEIMLDRKSHATSLYSWHDFNRHHGFGRGIVYCETLSEKEGEGWDGGSSAAKKRIRDLYFNYYNKITVSVISNIYYMNEKSKGSYREIDCYESFFPIVGKELYYGLFGPNGFLEYQVIVPLERFNEFIADLQAVLRRTGVSVTLASLKLFRGKPRYLNFCADGICLAMDAPNTPQTHALFGEMDRLTLKYAGVVNIAKDSRINNEFIASCFTEYDLFRKNINRFDGRSVFRSQLSDRLGV